MRKLLHSLILYVVDRVFRLRPFVNEYIPCAYCDKPAEEGLFDTYDEYFVYHWNCSDYQRMATCNDCDRFMEEQYHYADCDNTYYDMDIIV